MQQKLLISQKNRKKTIDFLLQSAYYNSTSQM